MTKWDKFFDEKIKEIAKEKVVYDIGGGKRFQKDLKPYESYFKDCDYKTIDIDPEYNPDILADAHALPITDDVADGVICKSVLEHVENPFQVVDEIYRILKYDGKSFVYVPFLYPYHGSGKTYKDYYRYSKDGIEYLFRKFSKIEIMPIRGYFETILNLLPYLNRFFLFLGIARFLDMIFIGSQSQNQVSGYYIFLTK